MQKKIFKRLFLVTVLVLMLLPFLTAFSQVLTNIFNRLALYVWFESYVVPFEAKLVVSLLSFLGIQGVVTPGHEFAMYLGLHEGKVLPVKLAWNCLGWQSGILLSLTYLTGLRGPYTAFSKIQVVVSGFLGTFLVNLMRMTAITALMYWRNDIAARVVHDYVAMFVALVWMIFFWWFVYSYVLEEKKTVFTKQNLESLSLAP